MSKMIAASIQAQFSDLEDPRRQHFNNHPLRHSHDKDPGKAAINSTTSQSRQSWLRRKAIPVSVAPTASGNRPTRKKVQAT